MFEVYRFPVDFVPFWHIGARMCAGPFKRFLLKIGRNRQGTVSLLDAGSGGGWHTLLAATLGAKVTCIDISPASIANTLVFAGRMGIEGNIRGLQGDCYHLPFADNSFDAVVSSHVIEHLDEPGRMLREIRRVLKPGGVLLLCCPSLHHGMRLSRWCGIKLDPPDHKVDGYEKEGLVSLLPEGFSFKRITYQGRFLESNLSDIQGLLARLSGIKANPDVPRQAAGGQRKEDGFLSKALFCAREALLTVCIIACRIEDLLFFYVKGSALCAEIELNKDSV